jgi:very-short-patch-repair endonuclease
VTSWGWNGRLRPNWSNLGDVKPRIPLPLALAGRPFTARQGLAAGLGPHRLRGGDLQRPFHGVILPANIEPDFILLCRSLARRLPDNAFFCGIAAAKILYIPLPYRHENSRIVDVGVPAPGFPPSGRGIRGHMLRLDPESIRRWNDVPITTPEQTWCDLGGLMSVPELVAAGDYLIQWRSPLASVYSLSAAVSMRTRQRGVIRLRAALELLNDRSESPQESKLRVILTNARLPGLSVNLPITTSGGYRYRADLAFPERMLVIEYQSAFHENPASFRDDMTRISRLEADDWKVMQVNKEDIAAPVELVARIRRTLAGRPHFAR